MLFILIAASAVALEISTEGHLVLEQSLLRHLVDCMFASWKLSLDPFRVCVGHRGTRGCALSGM